MNLIPLTLTRSQIDVLNVVAFPDGWLGTRAEGTLSRATEPYQLGAEDATIGHVIGLVFSDDLPEDVRAAEVGQGFWVREEYVICGSWTRFRQPVGYTRWYDNGGYQWDGQSTTEQDFLPPEQMNVERSRYTLRLIYPLMKRADQGYAGTFIVDYRK